MDALESMLGSVCFDPRLIRRYGGRGPRYTSYPTALQFDEQFTADHYRQNALDSNAAGLPLSLYVHIPFCHSLCYYCGCNKIVTRNQNRVGRYLESLYSEIKLQAELFDDARKVEQLHLGGGTPTYLDTRQLGDLMQHLDEAFGLDSSDEHEFSIEVDPRSVDRERISELAGLGFNRLSLGVQDFDANVQKAVNREQSVEDVWSLVDAARSARFRSISFDLIYGLPEQSVDSFDVTLDRVIAMRPDRLAVYNYAHLPERFKGQRMIDRAAIPSSDIKLQILQRTIMKLTAAGYRYIGMDHFALPKDDLSQAQDDGTLQRNFQGYSTHRQCDLVGLGVSSIGKTGNAFAQNVTTTMQYEALVDAGKLPICKGLSVDNDDQLRAAAIQALMCYGELRFSSFNERFGIDFQNYFVPQLERLRPLENDGLLQIDSKRIEVKPKGRLLLRNIAMTFDRYAESELENRRFSRAI
jgi:oxygen-independent coproporphyrinogen III oxidase